MPEVRSIAVPEPVRDQILVPLTAGICLVVLAAFLKKILLVPTSQLSSDIILFIIIYAGFGISYRWSRPKEGSQRVTLLWIGMIIMVTVAIIVLYAI